MDFLKHVLQKKKGASIHFLSPKAYKLSPKTSNFLLILKNQFSFFCFDTFVLTLMFLVSFPANSPAPAPPPP